MNRIASTGTAAYKQYATSAWADSYTVAGAAGSTVHVSFSFAIDGNAGFDSVLHDETELNYKIYALRGDGWTLSGRDFSGGSFGASFNNGDAYERVVATRTTSAGIGEADLRDFGGFYNYTNVGGQPGSFGSLVNYEPVGDYYTVQQAQNGGPGTITRFYANGFRNYLPDGVTPAPGFPTIVPYSTNAQTQTLAGVRANLVANYALLGYASLCSDTCAPGLYPGSNLTLSFDLAAGSTFSLVSFLYLDDLYEGSIDFFHTAKMTGATATELGSQTSVGLTSTSGALTLQPDGSFGYPAATGAVPEPATWAMMLGGFGLLGAAMRRRKAVAAVA